MTPMGAKGVLAGPGTPRYPKSHLFVTNGVTIRPFLTSGPGFCAEFRCGSREGVPPPQSQLVFFTILDMFFGEMPNLGQENLGILPGQGGFPAGRPAGALGPYGAPWGPMGRKGGHFLIYLAPGKAPFFLSQYFLIQ